LGNLPNALEFRGLQADFLRLVVSKICKSPLAIPLRVG
jgi:hypothetical protein